MLLCNSPLAVHASGPGSEALARPTRRKRSTPFAPEWSQEDDYSNSNKWSGVSCQGQRLTSSGANPRPQIHHTPILGSIQRRASLDASPFVPLTAFARGHVSATAVAQQQRRRLVSQQTRTAEEEIILATHMRTAQSSYLSTASQAQYQDVGS